MKLLNLGCGHRFHTDWTNVDFHSTGPGVIAHNLLQGLPFEERSFNVIYHAHVLEHFTKDSGKRFIHECFRVLTPDGILRVVVPDLEQIARLYLQKLEAALKGDQQAEHDYNWMLLEMYDQTVRTKSGGDMAKYLLQENIPNEEFVYERIGEEGRQLRKALRAPKQTKTPLPKKNTSPLLKRLVYRIRGLRGRLKSVFMHKPSEQEVDYQNLGRFRLGGEIHQWMYDQYSLKRLLMDTGFKDVAVKTAFDSQIPHWESYELESKNGVVFKPDSLFVEARK